MAVKKTEGGILLTEGAAQQATEEEMQRLEAHLRELGKQSDGEHSDLNMVLSQEISRVGVPATAAERQELFDRCVAMAKLATDYKMTRFYAQMRTLTEELKVKRIPDFVQRSARRYGIELVQGDTESN